MSAKCYKAVSHYLSTYIPQDFYNLNLSTKKKLTYYSYSPEVKYAFTLYLDMNDKLTIDYDDGCGDFCFQVLFMSLQAAFKCV